MTEYIDIALSDLVLYQYGGRYVINYANEPTHRRSKSKHTDECLKKKIIRLKAFLKKCSFIFGLLLTVILTVLVGQTH